MPDEAQQTETKAEETKTEHRAEHSSAAKKPGLFSRLIFWRRPSHNDVEWNDLDFGVFWVVSLLLFFAKMGFWLLAAWVVVWFVIKSWKGK